MRWNDLIDEKMLMKKKLFFVFWLFMMTLTALAGSKVKVACVGNSVTWGLTIENRETACYPAQLQRLLGKEYEVRNFGHSGSTLLRHGHRPYVEQKEYKEALDFKADVVVIHLGLNDTDPRNWPEYAEEFNQDYINLIHSFRKANPKAKIYVCLLTPIFDRHARFESGTRDWQELIQEHVKQIAKAESVGLIDLHTPLYSRPDLFADAIHPNAEGAGIIAQTVFKAITGDYGGLSLMPLYTDGMVLQRGEPILFYGKANGKEQVKVTLAGKTATVEYSDMGRWTATLPKMEAGGPYEAVITAGRKTIKLRDIYVGEVWLCSGQSNMEMPVSATQNAKEDLAEADNQPLLHLFQMSALYPTNDIQWTAAVCDSMNRHQSMRIGPWERCSRESLSGFSAVAYHFGKMLADSLKVPIGVICNAVGGTTTESWIDRHTLEWDFPAVLRDWYHGDFGMKWARERALRNISASTNPLQRHPYVPAYMFETAMLPLAGYTVKGVVWYQGESNAHNVELHKRLFSLLEKSWRRFLSADVPFYFAQLSSLNRRSWPRFRQSQMVLSQTQPRTWMAVTSDLGDSLDVHYINKAPVGERLALQALHHTYGRSVESEGPFLVKMSKIHGGLRLQFSHAKTLSARKGALCGFEIAGTDGIFYPAQAVISGPDTVDVSSIDKVKEPINVRYGWQPFTRANLINEQGLPCGTFTTEGSMLVK